MGGVQTEPRRMQVGLGWHPWGGGQPLPFRPVSLTLLSWPSHHLPTAQGTLSFS